MLKLAIVHFNPIDSYPPVMNWLNYLSENSKGKLEVRVFTRYPLTRVPEYVSPGPTILIVRSSNTTGRNPLKRIWSYFKFYFSTTWELILWKPDSVLYYETFSSFPALFYKRFVRRNARLLVHYHEYTSPDEYRSPMTLNHWGHRLERRNYSLYSWVSHTNDDRMRLFLQDNETINIPNRQILPNYPPSSWKGKKKINVEGAPIRFIYVGSLSLDTMYTKEFSDWVNDQGGSVTWDIYSNNMSQDVELFFSQSENTNIRFQGGVNYFLLPEILRNYDIGLILYKGHIPNYVYNVPNKLLEYFACGLDVWFPDSMISSLGFVTKNTYPKILAIDFENLKRLDLALTTNHSELVYNPSTFFTEDLFDYFLKNGLGLDRD